MSGCSERQNLCSGIASVMGALIPSQSLPEIKRLLGSLGSADRTDEWSYQMELLEDSLFITYLLFTLY